MALIPPDPVSLTVKGKLISIVSCFLVILAITWLSQLANPYAANPYLIGSMGASAIIVFIIPNSPLGQPWPLVGGQLVSTATGIACAQMIPTDTFFAGAFAVGSSVAAMLLLRCLHPPGAASALAPILGGETVKSLGYSFLLMPVGINVAVMLAMALIINRWLLGHEYPSKYQQRAVPRRTNSTDSESPINIGISEQDIQLALYDMDTFLDVSYSELRKLLDTIHKHHFTQLSKPLSYGDIMTRNVSSVEYGTEVEDAWRIMHQQNLKALPVIDKSRRVIGIVTWHDFLKFISVDNTTNFSNALLKFTRRTSNISCNKPEAVGHIMTSRISVLSEKAPIAELIPLMSNQGHRQVPIVNDENRLVGMVHQANLISALYANFNPLQHKTSI